MQQGDALAVTDEYILPATLFSFKPFSKTIVADGKHAVLRTADMAFLRGHRADWLTLTEEKPEMNHDDDRPDEEVACPTILSFVFGCQLLDQDGGT